MEMLRIETDDTMRELRAHGTAEFPFMYYYEDVGQFRSQSMAWHWHKEFELISVESGMIDCLIGTERIRLKAGEGIFINSSVIHSIESETGGVIPNILFAPTFFASQDSAVYQKFILPVIHADCPCVVFRPENHWEQEILKRLDQIYHLAESEDFLKELRIQTLAADLWGIFVEQMWMSFSEEREAKDMFLQSRLQKMMTFISTHFQEKISLEDIAASASISKSEALRCFHTGVQTTPVRYLIDYRLGRASELLLSTTDTVTEISARVGFDDVSYFTRMFTRLFGVTPKAFRKRL